jgi:hypothetical protein
MVGNPHAAAAYSSDAAPHARMGDEVDTQQIWLALIGGLILGWLIEWAIDWWFWRRNLAELRQENQELRRQLDEARSQQSDKGK